MSKKFYTFVAIVATTFAGIAPAMAQQSGAVNDTVILGPGPGYSSEVYYNLATGAKAAVVRDKWDIAFRTSIMSASIITNDGSGVVLYTSKTKASGWAAWSAADTSGFNTWKPLYNSLKDWEMGAFNTYSKGLFDYGWGTYNLDTHYLAGDSIYVLKLRSGELIKLLIVKKASTLNTYTIRYAGLDNSNEHLAVEVNCNPYTSKNFVGYSFTENAIVDFEPAIASSWDLLFTKYKGLSGTTPYTFTGVLSNYNTGVARYSPVSLDFVAYDAALIDSSRSKIGADWKKVKSDFSAYDITPSTVYFIKDKLGNIHKLIFKEFDMPTGRVVFEKQMLFTTGVDEKVKSGFNAAVYPNPVSDVMNVVVNPGKSKSVLITLLDLSGRSVVTRRYDLQSDDLSTLQIPVHELKSGMYMVKIQSGSNVISRKVVVNN